MEERKNIITKTDIIAVTVVIAALMAAFVPVMAGWNSDKLETAARNEGWVYLNAARAVVDEALEAGAWEVSAAADGSAFYAGILANPEFAGFIRKARLRHIPPAADGFPHINDIYVDAGGYPSAVFIRNILKTGEMNPGGLTVGGSLEEGGYWLRGGGSPYLVS